MDLFLKISNLDESELVILSVVHIDVDNEWLVTSEVGQLVFVKNSLDDNIGHLSEHGGFWNCDRSGLSI